MVTLTRPAKHSDLESCFQAHQERLRFFVQRRLDRRLLRRIDPCDVLQDTFVEASRRFDRYQRDRQVPEYVWLCFLTEQRIKQLHRRHFCAQSRDIRREVPVAESEGCHETHSFRDTRCDSVEPEENVIRNEMCNYVASALKQLPKNDQQILQLRIQQQMSNAQAAHLLGISKDTAYRRYTRAITRLRKVANCRAEPCAA